MVFSCLSCFRYESFFPVQLKIIKCHARYYSNSLRLNTIKILCVIPALPNEIKMDTLQSVFSQSIPVTTTLLLTERINEKTSFPAKISKVLNNMLEYVRIEKFDFILRVDADTVLPLDFIEKNLATGNRAIGYGYAQLIEVKSFIKYMDGKFNPEHDDGYVIEKFKFCGVPAAWDYVAKPTLKRKMGFHHGSKWFVDQGSLKFMYGWDPVNLAVYVLKKFSAYSFLEVYGYFYALFKRKKRFDVATKLMQKNFRKYRSFDIKRFRKAGKSIVKSLKAK
jgi:hypothetical protein